MADETYNKYICLRKEKPLCIAVAAVKMFIETSGKYLQ
jgi:hypothetical protein